MGDGTDTGEVLDQPLPPDATPAAPDSGDTSLPIVPSTSGTSTWTRSQLRAVLGLFGIPLPITLTDLTEAAQKFDELRTQMQNNPWAPWASDALQTAGEEIAMYASQIPSLWGAGGEGSTAYQYFQDYLRPPTPDIAKIPTAEEFMGDFNNAWEAHLGAIPMGGQGGLSVEEANWANSYLKPVLLNQYMAHLAASATPGQSPFTLKEVARAQRGIEPGSPAGTALDQAVGPGVTEPTAIQQELTATSAPGATGADTAGAQVSKAAALLRLGIEEVGTGVPKEFQSVPNVMPEDFLKTVLTPANIKMLYAGSQSGGAASEKTRAPSTAQLVGEVAP